MVARKAQETQEPTEVEKAGPDWSKAQNFIDVESIANEHGLVVLSGSHIFGDGATLVEKDKLVGVPFKILEWHDVEDKETKRTYTTVLAMASRDGAVVKVRFNDGSRESGIRPQLQRVMEEYGPCIIECRMGLRKSTYTNEHGAGTTFYLT